MVCASVVDDEVPFEEGYIKLRGFTPTATKQEMMQFLQVGVGWGGVWGRAGGRACVRVRVLGGGRVYLP